MSGNQPQQVLTCMGFPFGMTMLPAMPDKPRKIHWLILLSTIIFKHVYPDQYGRPCIGGRSLCSSYLYTRRNADASCGMFLMRSLTKKIGKLGANGLKSLITVFLKAPFNKFKFSNALSKKLCHWGWNLLILQQVLCFLNGRISKFWEYSFNHGKINGTAIDLMILGL